MSLHVSVLQRMLDSPPPHIPTNILFWLLAFKIVFALMDATG